MSADQVNDPLNFMRNLWGNMGFTVPGMVAPTFDVEEIGLTERQAQVLCLMVRGLSNRDIGAEMGLSEGTIKIHATAVYKALGVTSRTQALVAVSRYGIDFVDVF